nr:LOW QUALITY PROTEIN: mucin-5B [Equus asinus]
MGVPRGCRVLAWALAALLLVQKAETQGGEELSWAGAEAAMDGQREAFVPCDLAFSAAQQMIFIPPITVFPTMSPVNPAHNGRVCSTWGDFHYKTFDGDVFRFPGLCNYVFSAHCGAAYEDFNIQLRRGLAGSKPTITHVVLKTQGLVLEISNGSILINGQQEELPYSRAGLLVEQSSVYVKVNVRLVLTFMWNGEDSALLELDPKYANQTCGLCGDFNGLPAINEFYAHNTRLTPLQFGNLQKLDGPMEQCQDPLPSPADNCTDEEGICRRTLLGLAFAQCHGLVDADVYVAACTQDLCRCPTCPCATFAEYSRQCTHAGGQPQNWRGPDLCPRTCPLDLQHQECGSPCTDTCSNPDHSQLCEDHCVDGCFCPPGTVLDDVSHAGCLPLEQCSCTHSGRTYAPGASFTTSCSSCTCSSGVWQCQDLPCPGTCYVQGGSHISTYDEKLYNVHGDCSYILSKTCADSGFTVLAELRQCGLTDNENCLKTVTLKMTSGGDTVIQIQANGGVFMNSIYTQLPVSAANITIFRPSSFFILVQTGLGLQLQVQLVPLMQVYLRLDPSYRGQMCGLCGNFNQNQADDFRILGGVVEGTAAAFANTWKTQAACPNVKNSFEDPCSLSVENENFAQHWCSLLTDPTGAFSPCHSIVNPAPFHSNCLFDTCNCEKSEACMCAALSSYVWACAAKGVLLHGWRDGVCTKYMSSCPKSQNYTYVVDSCQPTCRSLSQADVTCGIAFVPVDGCTCPSGTFLDDTSTCVPAEACPCYFRGSVVAPGEVVHDDGVVCSCVSGKLSCLGAEEQRSTGCVAPMLYLDCTNASAGTPGAECLRSCHVLDVDCFSTHCVSGCVCPPGLVSDGSGGCVAEEDCPCLHNEATYKPGETIRVDCNTCTCRNRRWECSHQPCLGTCVAYGDGHFITFDGERYSFEGSCEYTLVQDHCGGNGTANGTFRIVTENVPCGTTGVTCSKTIKLFLENYELILHEGTYKVVQRGPGRDLPYRIRYMGIYLTIETRSGMVVSWDRKTSVFIRLRQDYKGRVCGLCGNFDDNAINDFTTRSQSVVGNALEFGNSWKFSPSCPDAPASKDPCTANPYRKSWAQKQCSIINSATFATCRSQVDSTKYYEACVSDACACNSGGDCECFCTAVAAYAQACRDVGVCVSWRSPDVCPLFCDYYNPHGECEWHYEPCGAPCLRTCRNPSGHCLVDLPGLEGCYPRCPPGRPFFSEDEMECVAQCGCYDEDGNYHEVGARVPTAENCQSCECTPNGIQCIHSLEACRCTYEGKTYGYEEVIYNTTDGLGACLLAICGNNGTIIRSVVECPGTLSTTPFTFTTTAAPPSTTGSAPTLSTVCVQKQCRWSDWYDSGRPEPDMGGGDFETFANLKQRGHQVCPAPVEIECRAQRLPNTPLQELGQKVECNLARGLTCLNSEQSPPLCHNYELRVLCCDYVPCGTSPAPGTSPGPSPSVTAQVSTLKSLPTSTWTTPTRETPLQSTVASTLQTRPTVPATTAQTGSSSSTLAATTCQPKCQWTEWFDEDYPTSEKAGGDIESYDKIRSAGGAMCEQPQDIECKAENFPTVRPEELGQRVHCHPSFGLVCRNQEQPGLFKMCYNYRIRVLCCSNSHCRGPASATTTATTAATATTTTTTIATSTATATNTRSSPEVTTAVPFLSTGSASRATSSNLSHTDTLLTSATSSPRSPPGSTKPTTPGGATSVLPTRTTLQGTTEGTSQGSTSRPRLPTEAPTSTTRTVSTSPPSTSHTRTSTLRTETPKVTLVPTAVTETTTSQGTTSCQPKCEWTEWFDVDFPTSGVMGGDMETYENIRAAGGRMCAEPQKIECRAENYPEVSLDQIGQVLSCSLEAGLVCRNEDQQGRFNMCFNYNIRVLCCDDRSHCPSTAAPSPSSTATGFPTSEGPGLSTSATTQTRLPSPTTQRTTARQASSTAHLQTSHIGTTTGSPPIGPTSATTQLSSPSQPGSVTPTPTVSSTEGCKCAWTRWFDEDYPTPGHAGGDFETYTNIRAAGEDICEQPLRLECQAEMWPDVPVQELGQVVQCDVSVGLVCRNRDQSGPIKLCLNYHIRVFCCDYSHCPGTPATTTATPPATNPGLTSLMATSTTARPPTIPSPTSPNTHPTTATSGCQPACHWTDWLDSDRPKPGPYGGDTETYYHILRTGGQLCSEPVAIECQAVLFPEVPFRQLGQVVKCDVDYGLICRNKWQSGGETCLNYHIRVRCCDDYSHCASSAVPATTTLSPRPSTTSASTGRQSSGVSGVWSTATTQVYLSSPGTSEINVPTSKTGPSSRMTTHSVHTTQTPFTSLRTTKQVTVTTTKTGLSSSRPTEVTISTTETGPSSPGPTPSVPTTQTSLTSFRSTERVTFPTSQSSSFSPSTTELTVTSTETAPSSRTTIHSVPTTQTPFTSLRTTEVTVPTSETGPSSRTTTHSVPTTQAPFTSLSTTEKVTVPTTETGPSSPRRTPSVSTTQTPFTSLRTTEVTVPTSETGPSSRTTTHSVPTTQAPFTSLSTTEKVTVPTTETGPSSPRRTPSVSTTQTTFTSLSSTKKVTVPTTETGPSSSRPTAVTISTTKTGPSSSGPTPSVLTAQTSLTSFGSTERVTFPTSQSSSFSPSTTELIVTSTETGPSSRTTIHSVPTTQTPFTSLSTTEKFTVPTTETGPSSPRRTPSVSTTQTPFTSLRTTEVTVPTSETGPSSRTTTHSVPTTQAPFTSLRTTKQVTVPTTKTGLSSSRPTEVTTSTTETGPSSPRITPSVSTTQTPFTSLRTTEVTVPTSETGPSSRTTIHSVPTTHTPFTSLSTTEKVTVPTTETGPSSPGELLVSPPLRHLSPPSGPPRPTELTISTTETGLSSSRPNELTISTTKTGPSSPRPTEVTISTTKTGPPRTTKVTVPTSETGPSSTTTIHSVPTTQTPFTSLSTTETPFTSLSTTEMVTVPTTETGPSSPRPTELTISTTETALSSSRPTELTISTTKTGPSSSGPTPSVLTAQTSLTSFGSTERVTFPTSQSSSFSPSTTELTVTSTETGPSSRTTIHSVPTTQTLFTSLWTTEKVTVPTSPTSLMSPVTTEITLPPTETHPSSPATMQRLSIPTTEIVPSSPRTTERVSITSPFASPGTLPTTTRPAPPSAPPTARIITTPWSSPSGPTSATTLLPSPSQPSSVTRTSTASSTEVCKPQCAWTRWFDEDYPTPGHAGGDFETYANIRAAGEDICEQPLRLECRAEMWPDVPVQELGQVVQCDVSVGLVCRNRDQSGPIKLCLNYHIRVFCCDYSHCPGTPATTTVTPPVTSPGLTSLTATGTTARPPTIPSPTSPNTHPTTATSGCQPACHWTDWLDSDRPKPGPYGGDTETYYHILRTGGQLCSEPVAIECQAVLFPEVPFRQLGQVVKCDVDYGLICRNKWQSGGETCLNYHIRVRCCDDYSHCASSAVPATTTLSPRPSTTSASTGRQSSGVSGVWSTATTQVYLSSPGTTERLSIHTSQTGPSSPWTTGRVFISSSSASPRTQTRTATPGLPSAPPSPPLVTSHMWTTTAISSSLPHFSVSTASPSILTTPGPTAFPSPLISTTACLCRAFGQLFSPGDVIYNKTDSAGCQFYAICNQRCDIDRFQGSCPTSSPSETSVTLTSPVPGCDLIDPPRQVNESWTLENCTVARCEGENHIVLLEPKPVANITCVNGHLPVKVWSENERCTYHLECECSCSGWGHSHYKTFDGTSYSFRDNCTHVLMREIRPLYGNLSIYINNYYCGATAATTHCPRALIVHYKSMEIILTTTTGTDGQEQSLILFDQRRVSEVFSKNGVNVSVTGTTMMHIDISAILVSISFDGHIFQARLSYSHFSHNTEGLCGTCTNSQTDDCRRPDGTMAPTCKDMASSWLVPDSSKEGCQTPPPTTSPLPHTPTTPTSPPCAPAPLCKLLLSQVFAECHSLIPPGPFFSTCVSDGCQTSHPNVSCQSLEAYAALCHARGVCSNWRNATAGLCELTCPPTKVYKSCGPVQPEACNSRSQSPVRKGLAEGCFCPDGHILFNSYTDICVPQCPCVGPDGFPKFPGERWVSNCQACVCDKDSVSVQCVPVQCKAQDQPLECSRAGFLTITRPLADNPCCQETLCICNVTTCPQSPLTCGPGLELTLTQREGDCCPTFHCTPKLCTYNGTFYGVGATFPGVTPCHKCTCLSVDTGNLTVQCEENTCNTTCPQGFEYSEVAGQCCGECVQTACLTPSGGLVQPNETWVNSPVDNCTEYHCQAENGLLVLTPRPVSCPIVSSCRGVLQKRGCCYSCEDDSCRVRVQRKALRLGDCVSPALVNVPFCEGSCLGLSVYSLEAQAMQHECTCCQEKRAHQEVVTLQCPDGTTIQYTYIHVDACSCTPGCAPSPEAPEDSTPILLL